jgi:hypothetical protein
VTWYGTGWAGTGRDRSGGDRSGRDGSDGTGRFGDGSVGTRLVGDGSVRDWSVGDGSVRNWSVAKKVAVDPPSFNWLSFDLFYCIIKLFVLVNKQVINVKMGKKPSRGVNQGRGHKTTKKLIKTKNRRKALDEIDADLKPKVAAALLNQEIDFDLPGKGQHYCLHCAR